MPLSWTLCSRASSCRLFFLRERERELSSMAASHIAPREEEVPCETAQREECSSERRQDATCPWNICGPVPRLTRWGWDLFVSRSLSRLAHHRETSPKSYRWEKVERGGFSFFLKLKRFLWYGRWDFFIIVVEKPILLQFRLQANKEKPAAVIYLHRRQDSTAVL